LAFDKTAIVVPLLVIVRVNHFLHQQPNPSKNWVVHYINEALWKIYQWDGAVEPWQCLQFLVEFYGKILGPGLRFTKAAMELLEIVDVFDSSETNRLCFATISGPTNMNVPGSTHRKTLNMRSAPESSKQHIPKNT